MDGTLLCICGKPADDHKWGVTDHPYTPPQWPKSARDQQTEQYSIRDRHYGLTETRLVTVAAPAAGVDIVATVPAAARWSVLALSAQLVASAVVANRVPHLVITGVPDARVVLNAPTPQNQAAGQTVIYSGSPANTTYAFDGAVVIGLPDDMFLEQKWQIGFSTTALQAGDQWGVMSLLVVETLYF